MIKFRKFLIAIALIPFLLVSSCVKQPEGKVTKSLLIYMVGENNLSGNTGKDLKELTSGYVPDYFEVGEGGDVLMVYVNRRNENPKLFRISKDASGDIVTELIMEYEEHNSCDDSVMHNVLSYAANLFPADYNGLIFWDHGSGWLPSGYYTNPYSISENGMIVQSAPVEDPYAHLVKSYGYYELGKRSEKEMEVIDLAKALPIHYSCIMFDACLMGGIEVAYELKDKTDYIISSAAEIMADGFPYQYIGELFFNTEGNFLDGICKSYYDYYNEKGQGATISLVKTSALSNVATACMNVFLTRRSLIPSLNMDDIQGYFRYDRHYFYDLDDFIGRIALPEQYSAFKDAMDKAVISKYYTENFFIAPGAEFEIKKFSGLSTYIPNPENKFLDEFYKQFAWNKTVQMIAQ